MKTFIGILVEFLCLFAMVTDLLFMFVIVYIVSTNSHNDLNCFRLWASIIGTVGLFLLIYWIRHTYGYFAKYEKIEIWVKRE